MATTVKTVDQLQSALKSWFRKPGETDEEYRDRINNDPGCEISLPLFQVPAMLAEQEERLRFDAAKPVEPVYPSIEDCKKIDTILIEANKKEEDDA